jgi:uncharacterized protein (TIGR03086 family)
VTASSEPIELLLVANDEFARRLRLVGPDDSRRPTPCSEWGVRALVNHVIGGKVRYQLLLSGGPTEQVEATRTVDQLGDDALASFLGTSDVLVSTFQEDGALARIAHHVTGDRTGRELLSMRILDATIHGWDLARAIGADETLDEDVVAFLLTFTAGLDLGPQQRAFAPETADGPRKFRIARLSVTQLGGVAGVDAISVSLHRVARCDPDPRSRRLANIRSRLCCMTDGLGPLRRSGWVRPHLVAGLVSDVGGHQRCGANNPSRNAKLDSNSGSGGRGILRRESGVANSVRVIVWVLAFFVAGCTANSRGHTVIDSVAVSIATEVEEDPAKAAIAMTYLNMIANAKQAYLEADRTDAAGFKQAEHDLMLSYEGAALNGLLRQRGGLPDSVKLAARDIRVNAVTVDQAVEAAVLTTDETWAVLDPRDKYLFTETNALHTVEMRLGTNDDGGERWIVSEVS